MMHDFVLTLAGVSLRCRLRFASTVDYFEAFAPACDSESAANAAAPAPVNPDSPVGIPEADWSEYLGEGMTDSAHSEYSMLTYYASDALLPFDRVVLHGVALRWRERAYLICAPSGVGKSTQARALQALRPAEFGVICGDRPVLEFRPSAPCHSEQSEESVSSVPFHRHSERSEESASPVPERSAPVAAHSVRHSAAQSILVHPSPWNGKENWHGAEAAPLAGLILLERGPENRLTALTELEAMIPMYPCFLQSCWEPENIRRTAALETRLLRAVPIWKLTTDRVPDSTRLLLEAVFSE